MQKWVPVELWGAEHNDARAGIRFDDPRSMVDEGGDPGDSGYDGKFALIRSKIIRGMLDVELKVRIHD